MTTPPSKTRRIVSIVKEEPVEEGRRPRLRAFGRATIAKLSGVSPTDVKNAIRRKAFDPDSLESTMRWIEAQKTRLAFPGPEKSPPP